jgi:hypothetical protein
MEPLRHRPTASQGNSYSKSSTHSHTTDPSEDAPPPERSHARNLSRRLQAHGIRSRAALPGSHGHKHEKHEKHDKHDKHDKHEKHAHKHRSVRHAAKDTVQSAIDIKPPATFDYILRRGDRGDKDKDKDKRSPDSSRRGSLRANQQPGQSSQDWDFAQQQAEAERRRIKPEDVRRLRSENDRKERELQGALKRVEALGMQSTRQLDDTYYSILEKAESMRNTLAEMQRLADESKAAREIFETEAGELEQETGKTMDGFGEFTKAEESIDGYVNRLAEAKTKTEGLNERLEGARKRVEAYEKRYRDSQAKRRKQWNITWGALLAGVVLLLALLIAKNHRHVGYQFNGLGKAAVVVGDVVDEIARPITQKVMPSPSEDPVLGKMFEDVIVI